MAPTLRFHDEKGLIASTGRRGLRRLFDPGVLERLALIALGRAAGFSLDEIARMFAPEGQPHKSANHMERDLHCPWAAEHRGGHDRAVLGEGIRQIPNVPL
jgi:DNA-binding transcriptional MerR regulator